MAWKKNLKIGIKIILRSTLYFVVFVVLYLIFSRIPVAAVKTTTKKNVEIFILSNGVHINWSNYVLYDNIKVKDSVFQYLAFGWGDKGFYLKTPSWGELKFSTAFKAVFGLSTSAIHTTFYTKMKENTSNCKKIFLSTKQYKKLIRYIKQSFKFSKRKRLIHIPTTAVYGNHDAFYDEYGNYNLFKTCNIWTNTSLKICEQKACLWIPFQGGIFYQYQ